MPDLLETLLLGLLQGPVEVLPVSSSAHVALLPWLLRWRHADLSAADRRQVEVALHAGTALALVAARPRVRWWFAALSVAPAACAGGLGRRAIERHLSAPPAIAAGLAVGAVALWCADAVAGRRRWSDARPVDALAVGLAQACALWPGVSRSGASLAAARARGFAPADAGALAREAALPVLVAAAALEAPGLLRRPAPSVLAGLVAAGTSTAVAEAAVKGRAGRVPLRAWAAYRLAIAVVVLAVWEDRRA